MANLVTLPQALDSITACAGAQVQPEREGALAAIVVHTIEFLVDGLTVLLFAVATLQGVIGANARV